LAQTIIDGYFLRQFFISYDECNIPTVDEEGEIGIKKKKYTFQKRKHSVGHYNRSVLRIEKLVSHESIWNVSFVLYCT
jgi:hypothetical protein